jgi:hypothetical protein
LAIALGCSVVLVIAVAAIALSAHVQLVHRGSRQSFTFRLET